MLNLKNPLGRRVEVKVGADVTSGCLTRTSGIVGIPVENKLNGNTVSFVQEGIVALTLNMQGTLSAGSYLYWNRGSTPTVGLSLGAAVGDEEVAQILGADPSGATGLYLCRLNIGFPRATAGGANAQ